MKKLRAVVSGAEFTTLKHLARELGGSGRAGEAESGYLRQLSAVYLLAGRCDEAWQHACQAFDLVRQRQYRPHIKLPVA